MTSLIATNLIATPPWCNYPQVSINLIKNLKTIMATQIQTTNSTNPKNFVRQAIMKESVQFLAENKMWWCTINWKYLLLLLGNSVNLKVTITNPLLMELLQLKTFRALQLKIRTKINLRLVKIMKETVLKRWKFSRLKTKLWVFWKKAKRTLKATRDW